MALSAPSTTILSGAPAGSGLAWGGGCVARSGTDMSVWGMARTRAPGAKAAMRCAVSWLGASTRRAPVRKCRLRWRQSATVPPPTGAASCGEQQAHRPGTASPA